MYTMMGFIPVKGIKKHLTYVPLYLLVLIFYLTTHTSSKWKNRISNVFQKIKCISKLKSKENKKIKTFFKKFKIDLPVQTD